MADSLIGSKKIPGVIYDPGFLFIQPRDLAVHYPTL